MVGLVQYEAFRQGIVVLGCQRSIWHDPFNESAFKRVVSPQAFEVAQYFPDTLFLAAAD